MGTLGGAGGRGGLPGVLPGGDTEPDPAPVARQPPAALEVYLMRTICRPVLSGLLWLIYWAVYWFARYSKFAKLRGAQYRATGPLAAWAYRALYDGKPEKEVRY